MLERSPKINLYFLEVISSGWDSGRFNTQLLKSRP